MAHSRFSSNIWPGFVDMLSALVTVLLFSFMIFIITHFYLQGLIQTREKSLSELRERIAFLQKNAVTAEKALSDLQKTHMEKMHRLSEVEEAALRRETQLKEEMSLLQEEMAEKNKTLTRLQEELTVLSAKQLKELKDYRSEFFGRLKKALSDRTDVRAVGDRFLFQSEVLFELGSASVGTKGEEELKAFAEALKQVMKSLPKDIGWVLRVDGHTDQLPLKPGSQFSSNLELSVARALAVVNFLIKEGIPADRLVAAGFGQYHPVSPKNPGPQDRRIELTLDHKQKEVP